MANLPVIDKLSCSICGGTFFIASHAEQFILGGYGTAEFRSISNSPKTVLICIGCGAPVTPKPAYYAKGTTADIAETDFRKSVEAGQKYRKDNSIQHVAEISASPSEVSELKTKINDIKKAVDILSKPKPKPKTIAETKATE